MSNEIKEKLLLAALPGVVFDGWSDATLENAAKEVGVSQQAAKMAYPRGAVQMAAAFHLHGDDLMAARMQSEDLAAMRYSARVAAAVWFRLQAVPDRELVRRGMALFSLPQHAPEGARLVWGTADRIWVGLGDTSDDINWYSKRAILSGVYGSSVLFWLGDTSPDFADTRDFIDRRIADVMQFEKFKASMRKNEALSRFLSIPNSLLSSIKAPPTAARTDYPGSWTKNT